jgi:hypothetical protein
MSPDHLQYTAFGLLVAIIGSVGALLKAMVPKIIDSVQTAVKELNDQLKLERLSNEGNMKIVCDTFRAEAREMRKECADEKEMMLQKILNMKQEIKSEIRKEGS